MFGAFPFGGGQFGDALNAPPTIVVLLDLCDPTSASVIPLRSASSVMPVRSTWSSIPVRAAASAMPSRSGRTSMPTRTATHHCEE